ncbi:MAG: hypothetical protein H7257_00805 [Taibaiella sp.]|nr:hypothetical protein [Taibaiella sp.]
MAEQDIFTTTNEIIQKQIIKISAEMERQPLETRMKMLASLVRILAQYKKASEPKKSAAKVPAQPSPATPPAAPAATQPPAGIVTELPAITPHTASMDMDIQSLLTNALTAANIIPQPCHHEHELSAHTGSPGMAA